MQSKTLTDVHEALNHYKAHFRRDGLLPLEFSGFQALFPELESVPEVTSKWPDPWSFGSRPDGMAFEAPALEEFLIERLSPTDNVNGRVAADL